ncbi:hypothetical protein SAMN05880582_10787 [Rhizobium sp. RU20A]|uniref:DUF5330 domain-containing protein n=1 Tax=Rhizobium sp. RU20A TaxID=1907412 RepID=UPI000953B52D|nr:DUF5330 domain-containing protein [Rhizobium sp. RU20A]SIR16489.1 hypothetical protein SAMN05880582_10787 [Rhizobium sp. RU20A]
MWFLVKAGFWFSLVLVLLPFLDPSPEQSGSGPKVEIGETFKIAGEAIAYMRNICVEKPDVCEQGAETFSALGHRASEGARIAYEFLDARFGAAPDNGVMTGTVNPGSDKARQALPADAKARLEGHLPKDTRPTTMAESERLPRRPVPDDNHTPVPQWRVKPAP